LVTGYPYIRFYAGAPIVVHDSQGREFALGALCVIDDQPHQDFDAHQQRVLADLAAMVSDTLKLRQQRYQAERADEVKTAFLANMSHEIRTPMNGIMGILELLEQTPLDTQQQHYIKSIKSSNEHLLTIVNDILDLSKVESGKIRFESIPVDLAQLCQDVYQCFLATAKDNSVELTFDYPDNLPKYVNTDPVRVRQILMNLVNNAIKFTPKQGKVTIQAMNGGDKHQIKFNVIDTGVGIKPESLAVIFDAYNQADKFTHRLYGGTGLGLSVCKALAEGMGGTIKVTSEKNKGSTFTLSLPMIATDEISYQQWHQSHDETTIQPLERLPAHVLLAEDNELNAMVAVKSLKKYGYEVTRAKDGLEAVNFYKADPSKYHIILMDHQMPIMDGVEATKILKQSFSQLPPIIAVTAHAMHGDKEVYLNAGMQDYCTKPYKPEALDVMIQRWLHHVANTV
jgi:signal transduction histidine kinase/ActR/RegA family two-component response regulator